MAPEGEEKRSTGAWGASENKGRGIQEGTASRLRGGHGSGDGDAGGGVRRPATDEGNLKGRGVPAVGSGAAVEAADHPFRLQRRMAAVRGSPGLSPR